MSTQPADAHCMGFDIVTDVTHVNVLMRTFQVGCQLSVCLTRRLAMDGHHNLNCAKLNQVKLKLKLCNPIQQKHKYMSHFSDNLKHELWLMIHRLMSQDKNLNPNLSPWPFSAADSGAPDDTSGHDSSSRSNVTLAKTGPPDS